MDLDTKEIAKQLGRAGGMKTLKKHGKKHFKDMASKRWHKKENLPENSSK